MYILFALVGWMLVVNGIFMFESAAHYKNIGEYSGQKVILLLLAWPIVYPLLLVTGSWRD